MTAERIDLDDAPPAAVVLAGGASSRMGTPKTTLEWHGGPLLRRVCGVCRRLGGPVVVVRQLGQALPPLPTWVEVVDDPTPGVGPLMGIAAGLAHIEHRTSRCAVTATDHPFLHPTVLVALLERLRDQVVEVVTPVRDGQRQVMVSAWLTKLAGHLASDVAAGFGGPNQVLDRYLVSYINAGRLLDDPGVAASDPELHSLEGFNTLDTYKIALNRPQPTVSVELQDGTVYLARAASIAAATARIKTPYGTGLWALSDRNGVEQAIDPDGLTPLLEGDVLRMR